MDTIQRERTTEFYATMLIVKLQRQANSVLRKKLQLTLKHPSLSRLPLILIDLLSFVMVLLGGLISGWIAFIICSIVLKLPSLFSS